MKQQKRAIDSESTTLPGSDASAASVVDDDAFATRPRPRWHLLYFLLASFDIVTVSASLFMNHQMMGSFAESIEVNSEWSDRLGAYGELSTLATDVNMPGNEVFDTLDVAAESAEQRQALTEFEAALAAARSDLIDNVSPQEASPLLEQLQNVADAMQSMTAVQQLIFQHFENDEAELAGGKMATMDRNNANVAAAIGEMNVRVRELQRGYFAEQAEKAQFVRHLEYVIAAMILLMVAAVTLYGHKIAKQVRRSDEELREAAELARLSSRKANATLQEITCLRAALDEHTLFSVTDRQGKIIDVNEGFCRLSGYSREELLGADHRMLNSGHHPGSFWAEMWKVIGSGKPWRAVVCNRRKDGLLYWVDSTNVPQFDVDGKIDRIISLRFDVTQQKAAEQESLRMHQKLLEQRAELQAITDAIPAFIYYKDDKNTILDLNKTAADSLGLSPEDVRGRNTEEFFPASDAAAFLADDLEVIRSGEAKLGILEEYDTGERQRLEIRTDKIPLMGPSGEFERLVAVAVDITEITSARRQFEELQQRFERATDGALDGLWDYEPAMGSTWYSDQFKRLIGLEPDQFDLFEHVLESLMDLLHPHDRRTTVQALENHLKNGTPFDVKYRLQITSGEYRWFRARGKATRDSNGRAARMSGSITDVHEQHTAESRLDLATRAARVGLWDWDVGADSMYFSETYATMLGYPPGDLEMVESTWRDLVHPDDLDSALYEMERHFAGETATYLHEHRLRRNDGSWLWIRRAGELVERNEDGSPKRVIGVHVDIDATKKSAEALVEITSALDASTDCVFMFEADTLGFVYTNRGASEQVGYSAEELSQMTPIDIKPDFDLETFEQVLRPLRLGEEPSITLRTKHQHRDGTQVPVEVSLQLVAELGAAGRFLALVRDISEQLDSDQRLESAVRAAEAASQAKSEFLANMSHEIRTPMTAILGYVDLLGSSGELTRDPAKVADAIDTIERNAKHLLTIINDILDMSKIEAGAMTVERLETRPAQIVEEVASLMRPRALGTGIEFRVRYDSPIPETIQSDPTRLRQILLNLAGNAIKFTEAGSVSVVVDCFPSKEKIRFSVVDTGIGLSAEQRDSMARFDAFTQADSSTTRRFGGSGLGLRISNALAQMLGGGIEIESTEGKGSTFSVTINTGSLTGVALLRPESLPEWSKLKGDGGRTEEAYCFEEATRRSQPLLAEDGKDNSA